MPEAGAGIFYAIAKTRAHAVLHRIVLDLAFDHLTQQPIVVVQVCYLCAGASGHMRPVRMRQRSPATQQTHVRMPQAHISGPVPLHRQARRDLWIQQGRRQHQPRQYIV